MSNSSQEPAIVESVDVKFRSGSNESQNGGPYQSSRYHEYNGEEDFSSGEDEVFIDENGLEMSKPLMHPRQRVKIKGRSMRTRSRWRHFIWPLIYLLLFFASLGALVCLVIYLVDTYTNGLLASKKIHGHNLNGSSNVIGCSNIEVEDVWVRGIPKLMTESAFRLVDVNQDGVLDIIFGFATGGEGYNVPEIVCDIYFNGTKPCFGGLIALDGISGQMLWRHYTPHEIFSVNCQRDLTGDGVQDCLGAGRVGTFVAVSGKDGHELWMFDNSPVRNKIMNLYTPQYVKDLDGDGLPDIINIHGGDPFGEPGSATRMSGKIILFSSKTGKILRWVGVPDKRESYFSPVLYPLREGTQIVLFGTGGETHGGALWYITLDDLYKGNIQKAQKIHEDHHKGFMTPPVLVDLTGDKVLDIVFASFNSTVLAVNGQTFETLWNFTYSYSETYATPSIGYFNDDEVPDFLIKFCKGPGFPIYYHCITTVLDGKTGEPILHPYIIDSIGAQASPITISQEGWGNDIFLHWVSDCLDHEGQGGEYRFLEGTNVHEQSRSDLCRLRFKSSGFTKMYALSQHVKAPGVKVYYSESRKAVEHGSWENTTIDAMTFLQAHPEHRIKYREYLAYIESIKQGWRDADEAKSEKNSRLDNDERVFEPSYDYSEPNDGYESDYEALSRILKNQDKDSQLYKAVSGMVSDILAKEKAEKGYDYNYLDTPDLPGYSPLDPRRPNPGGASSNDGIEDGKYSNMEGMRNRNFDGGIYNSGYEKGNKIQGNGRYNSGHGTMNGMEGSRELKSRNMDDHGSDSNRGRQYSFGNSQSQQDHRVLDNSAKNRRQFSGDRTRNSVNGVQNTKQKAESATTKQTKSSESPVKPQIQNRQDPGPLGSPKARKLTKHISLKRKSEKPKRTKILQGRRKSSRRRNNVRLEDIKPKPMKRQSLVDQVKGIMGLHSPEKEGQKSHAKHAGGPRKKRHVGVHDMGGIQRLISTGTLVPPTLPRTHPDYPYSMDVVFATYWFYPAETKVLLPVDQECIDQKMSKQTVRFDPKSKYYGMDDDSYEHEVTEECLEKSGHQLPKNGIYQSQTSYNPYDVHMGQLTAYRMRIKCTCKGDQEAQVPGQQCSRMMPHPQQGWGAYMGLRGDSQWEPPRT